jgi:hypothetical protein
MVVRLLTLQALAVIGLVTIAAAVAQEDWQADLANEALIMEDCDVSFLTQVIEREIDGRAVVMAKMHCVDGRTFDALRDDTFAAFAFTICEPEEEPAAC